MRQTDGYNLWRADLTLGKREVKTKPLKITSGKSFEVQPFAAAGGQVVFSRQALNADIWGVPIAADEAKVTGDLKRITRDPASDLYPSLSADGGKMAFQSDRRGVFGPWLLDLKTGAESPVVNGKQDQMWPRISPDGSKVGYTEARLGRYEHFYAATAGGGEEFLCEDCGPRISDWTKDGKIKQDPTPVLLNEYAGKPGPTFCPDCGRRVVAHNPPPVIGAKPPPTKEEYAKRQADRTGSDRNHFRFRSG